MTPTGPTPGAEPHQPSVEEIHAALNSPEYRAHLESHGRVFREVEPTRGGIVQQQPGESLDIHAIREEWGYADEAGQREWALEHADDLMAEVERLRRDAIRHADATRDALAIATEQRARAEAAEAKVRAVEAERDDYRDNPRDEHHTMAEVYDYRMLYNAHAAAGWWALGIPVVKSWHHSDGEPCFGGGWFIVTATLPTGQVSNHYQAEYWDLFAVPEVDLPPEYDGHTPQVAADRLRAALADPTPEVRPDGE